MNKQKIQIIDLFSGCGGAATGILRNEGTEILCAIDYDENAVKVYEKNIKAKKIFCEDIRKIDLNKIPSFEKNSIKVIWASPECTNFSIARGNKLINEESKDLAFEIEKFVKKLNPDFIFVENVPQFQKWEKFGDFKNSIQKYGFKFDFKILNAADFGCFTSRKRFFGCFFKHEYNFPEKSENNQGGKKVSEIIDFQMETKSLFEKKFCDKTLYKISVGIEKFKGENFILCYYNKPQFCSLENPLGTITTIQRHLLLIFEKGGEIFKKENYNNDKLNEALRKYSISDIRYRFFSVNELKKIQDFPDDFEFSNNKRETIKQIGNSVIPKMSELLIKQTKHKK